MFVWNSKQIGQVCRVGVFHQRDAGRIHKAALSLLCGVCISVLASCADFGGPEYKRPEVPTKDTWTKTSEDVNVSAKEVIRPDWWTGFEDTYLNKLVQEAVAGSYDLKLSALRVEAAGVDVGGQKLESRPKIQETEYKATLEKQEGEGFKTSYTLPTSSLGVNWEIDIWGKLRKQLEAKKADFKASEAEWRAVYLTTVSSVATKYFEIRQFDEQLAQQQKAADFNQQLLKIYEAQLAEGIVAESEVLNQRAEIDTLTKELLEIRRQREVAELNLATLLGIPAGTLKVPVAPLTGTVKALDVPAGLPSDLLSRRPDIIAAEYKVLSAHELVGVAKLEKLPSIKLTASAGTSSDVLSNILKGWTFGIGPTVSIPIFDPSKDIAIKRNKVTARIAEETYKQTVIKAFEEVEVALTNLASRKQQKKLLESQIEHLKIVRDVRYRRLREGLVSQLEVFDTDRSLLSAQQSLLGAHQQILSDTVTLYKALGGGWPKEIIGQESI